MSSIVWVIERQKPEAAFHGLLGDFAVRVFASLATFHRLVRLARRHPPGAVVIDADDFGGCGVAVLEAIDGALPGVPIIVLQAAAGATLRDGVLQVSKPVEPLSLVSLVDRAMRGGRRRGGVLRYRDVLLDYERHECVVMPGDDAQGLPLKEAQLLKLFLERPGICLTREQITEIVWSGVKVGPRTVDSHVSRLRKRLSGAETTIESVYGGGYVLR